MDLENKPDLQDNSFKDVFLNSPIGIFIVQDGLFRFVNAEFKKITGYSADELSGMESSKIVLEEDVAMVRENAVKMLKGERERPYMFRVVDKAGELRWINESVTSINYGGRRATLGYFMDNTEHERAKEAVRISEDKFQKAFRSSPEWFVISTLDDGFYLDVNDAFLKATGYRREEVIGHTSVELGIWEDTNKRAEMVEMLKNKLKVRDLEVGFRMKSGEIRSMLWSAEIIDYGEEKCLLAVTRDITHRKRAEQEKLQREKLQGVLEMAGATCHELGQPLQIAFAMIDRLVETTRKNDNIKKLEAQLYLMKDITENVRKITAYKTKDYISGQKIIDIEEASRNR
jgi:PAS domain S-box-containing protein